MSLPAGRNPLLPELLALPAPEPAASAELANGHTLDGEAHPTGASEAPSTAANAPAAAASIANGTGEASAYWPSSNKKCPICDHSSSSTHHPCALWFSSHLPTDPSPFPMKIQLRVLHPGVLPAATSSCQLISHVQSTRLPAFCTPRCTPAGADPVPASCCGLMICSPCRDDQAA